MSHEQTARDYLSVHLVHLEHPDSLDQPFNAFWKHFVSERNKAIRNVELLGTASVEGRYRIQQVLTIGPLKTSYETRAGADFLPYAREDVENLVDALLFESNNQEDKWVSDEALWLLNNSALLQQGYQYYTGKVL